MLNRITLNDLCNILQCYRTKHGSENLITIETTSENEYIFIIETSDACIKLPIPQYKDRYSEKINDYINFKFD